MDKPQVAHAAIAIDGRLYQTRWRFRFHSYRKSGTGVRNLLGDSANLRWPWFTPGPSDNRGPGFGHRDPVFSLTLVPGVNQGKLLQLQPAASLPQFRCAAQLTSAVKSLKTPNRRRRSPD